MAKIVTDKVKAILELEPPPPNKTGRPGGLSDEEAYAIITAVRKKVLLKDIAKALGTSVSGLYNQMGVWALNSVIPPANRNEPGTR